MFYTFSGETELASLPTVHIAKPLFTVGIASKPQWVKHLMHQSWEFVISCCCTYWVCCVAEEPTVTKWVTACMTFAENIWRCVKEMFELLVTSLTKNPAACLYSGVDFLPCSMDCVSSLWASLNCAQSIQFASAGPQTTSYWETAYKMHLTTIWSCSKGLNLFVQIQNTCC